ncbi:hypothetical protein [Phenylobacterium sp.]|uniref:hypothetical protein n=1 Tax=Phenylobacterium sp. TaxID=1871053 RepID=UPI0012283D63|nr:hypothetical protein [Phenylobacterium sp.]THD60952.1 MAG: hypothetical protein E8A49_11795 [Phenylobacterium sp.]
MDGTDLIEADETDLLSDAAVAHLRGHPRFREAVEAFARESLVHYEQQDAATRWLLKDLGRAALYLAATILDGTPEGLTFARLAMTAASNGTCSRGRVLAFVHYAQAAGRLTVPPGPEPWARRRLVLTPAFIDPTRERLVGALEATAIVAPEVAEALPRLKSDTVARQAATAVGMLLNFRPELNRNPGGPLRQIFIARDGGMRMLQHLMVRQPAQRGRLMETARLSRAELARRYGVSRTHVNRLLDDAQAAGALTLPAADRVEFSSAFSDEVEAFFGGVMQVNRVVARTLMAPAD